MSDAVGKTLWSSSSLLVVDSEERGYIFRKESISTDGNSKC